MLRDVSRMTREELVKAGFDFRFGTSFHLEGQGETGAFSSTLMGVQITVILKTATCSIHSDVAHKSSAENPSVGGRAPVCKDIFAGISVTASNGVEAKQKQKQTNKPSSLDANRTSLSGGGVSHPSCGYQL